jgi:perosamine synthetase
MDTTLIRHEHIRYPVYQPDIGQAEIANVVACLESGWISSKGQFVERFEAAFKAFVNANYAITTTNGTTALHLAIAALGLGPGDEVIVPSLTYVASVNAITYVGATPVFVDSILGSWQASTQDILRVISPRTRAIMAVHLYGLPCDMEAIECIAKEHGLLVIEDCAEALGSYAQGIHVGGRGDIATFSFYGNKTITTGEGGMVVTNNHTLAERVTHLKGQGLAKYREYWHDVIGFNYRMTNICAAIGLAQLERVETFLKKKRLIAEYYKKHLGNLVDFQSEPSDLIHSYWMVSVLVKRAKERDQCRNVLANAGVETRPLFFPVHSMPMYTRLYRRLPVADDISSRGITLPSYPALTEDDVQYICDAFTSGLT